MTAGVSVTLFVYDLAQSNTLTRWLGLGKYLATVEIYGTRVWAGKNGVETSKDPLDLPLRWTGVIGHTTKSRAETMAVVEDLRDHFKNGILRCHRKQWKHVRIRAVCEIVRPRHPTMGQHALRRVRDPALLSDTSAVQACSRNEYDRVDDCTQYQQGHI